MNEAHVDQDEIPLGDGCEEEGLRGVESGELLRFADAYASLGDAVAEQIKDLLDCRYDDVNPNAVRLIRERLGGFNREIDAALDAYDAWAGEQDDAE